MSEPAGAVPPLRILARPGEIDESRLSALDARITNLEQQHAELLDLVHRMTQTAAREHDLIADRVREMELAQ